MTRILLYEEQFNSTNSDAFFKKQKHFVNFFLCFWNVGLILNILKKEITLIGYVFSNISTRKAVVR